MAAASVDILPHSGAKSLEEPSKRLLSRSSSGAGLEGGASLTVCDVLEAVEVKFHIGSSIRSAQQVLKA